MQIFFITAKRKNEPKSRTYTIGWRANLDNLVIEKAVTERTTCFNNLTEANFWLTWAMRYLPSTFSYKIFAVEQIEDVKKNMNKWTQPIWSRHLKDVPEHILQVPFYLRKD